MDILRKFLKQVGPNKQVGWRKKAVNLKQVGLLLVEFQKIVPNTGGPRLVRFLGF